MPKNDKYSLTYIGESGIHGHGLFAKKIIKKNQVIGFIEGTKTTVDDDYVLWINTKEGFEVSCCLKYINHADSPNACYYDDLSVVALTDIPENTEITHNYEPET
ncbi:MAG: SET domain-containing protein [Gammaproteobacteria bacterium]|nr:SET domain-containing protein [Gammaproteobacteria bacterium]